jgi:hypothetical protein
VTRTVCATIVLLLIESFVGMSAFAQTRPARQRDRFEASIGGLWIGGAGLGSTQADLRSNNLTPTPFRLFSVETDAAAAPGFDARFGYWLTRTIAIEAGFVGVRPELRTRVTSDAEGAAALTAVERLDQYFVEAGMVWLLEQFRFRGIVPFVAGGAGYLRQLHEGRTLVETGQVYQAGGGIRRRLVSDVGWLRAVGLRLDGRVYVLVDGVQLEDRPRTHGAFSGSLFVTF